MLAAQLPLLATVTDGRTPNIGPKRSLRRYDDEMLIFNENTGGQHLRNLQVGSRAAVAVVDREARDTAIASSGRHRYGPRGNRSRLPWPTPLSTAWDARVPRCSSTSTRSTRSSPVLGRGCRSEPAELRSRQVRRRASPWLISPGPLSQSRCR